MFNKKVDAAVVVGGGILWSRMDELDFVEELSFRAKKLPLEA